MVGLISLDTYSRNNNNRIYNNKHSHLQTVQAKLCSWNFSCQAKWKEQGPEWQPPTHLAKGRLGFYWCSGLDQHGCSALVIARAFTVLFQPLLFLYADCTQQWILHGLWSYLCFFTFSFLLRSQKFLYFSSVVPLLFSCCMCMCTYANMSKI